jgi:hypothetical protein
MWAPRTFLGTERSRLLVTSPPLPLPKSILRSVLPERLLLWVLAALLTLAALPAFPWGRDGHETIAALAQTMLSNNVLTKVRTILNTNELASVSVWADQVRSLMKDRLHPGPLTNSVEAHEFIAAHPDNDQWHFVDLPLSTSKYEFKSRFAATNDIVHTLTNCIAVLEGKSGFITTTQALRYIIHLVGDIHQPLHVACGYYVENPQGVAKLRKRANSITNTEAHDRGANLLVWSTTNQNHNVTTNNMHAYWDGHMVTTVDPTAGNKHMLEILTNAIATNAQDWKDKGDYHQWPALWAADSAKGAKTAFVGVTIQSATFKADSTPKEIRILPLNSAYDDAHRALVTRQLAKAAFSLAELLNRIKWP